MTFSVTVIERGIYSLSMAFDKSISSIPGTTPCMPSDTRGGAMMAKAGANNRNPWTRQW